MRYLLLILLLSAGVQAKSITGKGSCVVGDYMTINEATSRAYEEAKIDALNAFGVYISYTSTYRVTELNDLNSSYFASEIKTMSWSILKTTDKKVTKTISGGIVTITVLAVFNLNEKVFQQAVDRYIKEESAKRARNERLKNLQEERKSLRLLIKSYEQKLKKLDKEYYKIASSGNYNKYKVNKPNGNSIPFGFGLSYIYTYDRVPGVEYSLKFHEFYLKYSRIDYYDLNYLRNSLSVGAAIKLSKGVKLIPSLGMSNLYNSITERTVKSVLLVSLELEFSLAEFLAITLNVSNYYSGIGLRIII